MSPSLRKKKVPRTHPGAGPELRRAIDAIPQPVWSAFPDGTLEFCNRHWLYCTGLTGEQAQGWGWMAAIHPDDLDEFVTAWRRILADGLPGEAEARVRMSDGTYRWFLIRATPERDDNRYIVRWILTNVDINDRKQAENALRESEQRFRLIADTAPVLIWMSGCDKQCTYFNKPWLNFTGRALEAEIGNGWTTGVHPEDLARCVDTYSRAFERRQEFRMEYRLRRHDGGYRWIVDIGVPRFDQDHSFVGYIGVGCDVTELKVAEQTLASLSRKLIRAQELERTRIARELHDDINQHLAMLAFEIQQLKSQLPKNSGKLRGRIVHLWNQTSAISTDVQALSHRLHSSKLEHLGLVAAARSFCNELSKQQKLKIEFNSRDVSRDLPQEVALSLFRVLQEALHNSSRHSRVKKFEVQLWQTPGELHLTIDDRGTGFDVKTAMKGQGLGLISMKERIKMLRGTISIDSHRGRGTVIHVRVPLSLSSSSLQVAA